MINTFSFDLPNFDPLALYLSCCPNGPGFLESLNHLPKTGRYSFVPLRWQERYVLRDNTLWCHTSDQTVELTGKPLTILKQIQRQRQVQANPETPFPSGFFGYFSYDFATQIEDLPQRPTRDLPVPDLELYWVDVTATYDHKTKKLIIATLDANLDLQSYVTNIKQSQQEIVPQQLQSLGKPRPLITKTDFIAMVEKAKRYISAGDIYQVNLSCRFDSHLQGTSTELYRRLRQINPSPFACLLNFPDVEIISSSPERLVSLHNGIAETRPIAGTRPRGYTPPEDHQLADELLGHPKERAEHIMLLDLERNDLGKVCQAGSVKVDELMVLERYSHVTHIVSNVCGLLNINADPFDLLVATFPGGTITGVPKKRCMEIIDELEPVGRGSYTGSVGYISACGNMDLNILIRSFQRIGDKLSYQTGAGIVADSIPEQEWQECLHKGEAMRTLLQDCAG